MAAINVDKMSLKELSNSEDWVTVQQLAREWNTTEGTVYSFLHAEKARLKDYRRQHGSRRGFVYFRGAVERLRTLKCRGPSREVAWLEIKPPKPDIR